jgi:hypothetical protein
VEGLENPGSQGSQYITCDASCTTATNWHDYDITVPTDDRVDAFKLVFNQYQAQRAWRNTLARAICRTNTVMKEESQIVYFCEYRWRIFHEKSPIHTATRFPKSG